MTTTIEDDTLYNGWKNYETWVMALWIDNEEGTYREARLMADHAWRDVGLGLGNRHIESIEERARLLLAARLEETWSERNPIEEASVWADLVRSALESVDWEEIADHLMAERAEMDIADDLVRESEEDDGND